MIRQRIYCWYLNTFRPLDRVWRDRFIPVYYIRRR